MSLARTLLPALAGLLASGVAWPTELPGTGELSPRRDRVPALGCATPDPADFCHSHCAPAKLVFLPCMAVGAVAMAACREREIRACHAACEERGSAC